MWMTPSPIHTLLQPFTIGQSLLKEQRYRIVHPLIIPDAELRQDPQAMQEIIRIMQGIVQPEKIQHDHRVILVGPEDPVLQEKLRTSLCRGFPSPPSIVQHHLRESPHRLHSRHEGPVLSGRRTVPAAIRQLLQNQPIQCLEDPVVLVISQPRQSSDHISSRADVWLELLMTFGSERDASGFYIVKLEKMFDGFRHSWVFRRNAQVREDDELPRAG